MELFTVGVKHGNFSVRATDQQRHLEDSDTQVTPGYIILDAGNLARLEFARGNDAVKDRVAGWKWPRLYRSAGKDVFCFFKSLEKGKNLELEELGFVRDFRLIVRFICRLGDGL